MPTSHPEARESRARRISVAGYHVVGENKEEGIMRRERGLKVLLVVLGSLFCAGAYPLMVFTALRP
jgi:hypothetical protein